MPTLLQASKAMVLWARVDCRRRGWREREGQQTHQSFLPTQVYPDGLALVDMQSCEQVSRNATVSLGLQVLIPNSISTHE